MNDPEPLLRSSKDAFQRALLQSSASEAAPGLVKARSLAIVDRVLANAANATASSPGLAVFEAGGKSLTGSFAGALTRHLSLLKGSVAVGLAGAIGVGVAWQQGAFDTARSDDAYRVAVSKPRAGDRGAGDRGAGDRTAGDRRAVTYGSLADDAAKPLPAPIERTAEPGSSGEREANPPVVGSGEDHARLDPSSAAVDANTMAIARSERAASSERSASSDRSVGSVRAGPSAPSRANAQLVEPPAKAGSKARPRVASSSSSAGSGRSQVAKVEPSGAPGAPPSLRDGATSPSLREEVRLIEIIRSRLKAHQPERALEAVAAYNRRFPDGILAPEVAVLRERARALQAQRQR